jgi:hypothetical protein
MFCLHHQVEESVQVTKAAGSAQAVSCRLPTAAAQVRSQVGLCGIYGAQNDTVAGLLPVFQCPLAICIPLTAPHSSTSIQD